MFVLSLRENKGRLLMMGASIRSYKVLHQNCDTVVVEAAFDNYSDAVVHLANSIYMEPFIVIDDGDLDFEAISPDEARKFAVERIEFQQGATDD